MTGLDGLGARNTWIDLEMLDAIDMRQARVGDDSWLAIHTRADYTNAVTQLRASADNLNLTAANEPGWQPIYDNAKRLYDKYHDVGFFSSINPFGNQSLGDAAWNAIADSQRRIDEFTAQMRDKGKPVAEPPHKPIDNSLLPNLPSAAALTKYIPWIIGGVVVLIAVPVALPLVIPILMRRAVIK